MSTPEQNFCLCIKIPLLLISKQSSSFHDMRFKVHRRLQLEIVTKVHVQYVCMPLPHNSLYILHMRFHIFHFLDRPIKMCPSSHNMFQIKTTFYTYSSKSWVQFYMLWEYKSDFFVNSVYKTNGKLWVKDINSLIYAYSLCGSYQCQLCNFRNFLWISWISGRYTINTVPWYMYFCVLIVLYQHNDLFGDFVILGMFYCFQHI